MITVEEAKAWLNKSCPTFNPVSNSTECMTCHYASANGKCEIFHMEREGRIYG
jgi:hypothetical protein